MRLILAACLLSLVGCGRFWFDPQTRAGDAGVDAAGVDAAGVDAAAGDAGEPDTGPVGAPWWDPAFTRRNKVIVRGIEGLSADGFPLMLRLDASRMDLDAVAGDAADLRFLASDHATILPHEVESWSADGGVVWVRLPALPAPPDLTWVWMYYGNPGAPDASDAAGVWEPDHAAVYHLAGNAEDATGRGSDGTVNAATFVEGVVGQGLAFEATTESHVVIPDSPALHGLGSFTISAWVRRRAARPGYTAIAARRFGAGGLNDFWVGFVDDRFAAGMVPADDPTRNVHIVAGGVAPLDEWVHFAAAYDGAELCVHVNGSELRAVTTAIAGPPQESPQPVHLGADSNSSPVPNDDFLTGDLDEVRIETVSRSDGWLMLQGAGMRDELVDFGMTEAR